MFPKYVLLSICAFIRVHFGRLGKSSQHSPFRCIHIFQKLVMINEFFQRKVGNRLFSKACRFLARQLIFSFSTFFLTCLLLFSYLLSFSLLALFFFLICSLFLYLLFSFLFCSLLHFIFFFSIFTFIMIFVCFTYIFLGDVPKRRTLHGSRISNIIDSNDI